MPQFEDDDAINPLAAPRGEPGDTTCPICSDEMENGTAHTLAACRHTFHTECVVQWFRGGQNSCPMCRHVEKRHGNFSNHWNKLSAFETTAFRQYVKRPKANKEVVRMFNRYLKCDKEAKERTREYKAFNKENNAIIKQWRKLRSAYYTGRSKVRHAANELRRIPVVPFIVPVYRRQNAD